VPPLDLPPPGSAHEPAAIAGYDDGLYVATRDDAFHLGINAWLQTRWEIAEQAGDVTQAFSLPVGRITLAGHAFAMTEFMVSTDAAIGVVELRDAFVDQPVFGGKLKLRLGQFKPRFSHQQTMYRSELQFTDRPITAAFTGFLRDVGASLHREPRGRKAGLEFAVGVFNGGTFTPPSMIVDGRPLAVVRIGYRGDRVDALRDDDMDHGRARAAFGAGYAVDLADGEARDMTHIVTADWLVKGHGVSFGAAGFLKSVRVTERKWELAFHAQLGYALVPRLVEIAGRFAQAPFAIGDRQQQEAVTALDIYRREHRVKIQLEAGVLRLTGLSDFGWVGRAQTQLVF
jgi:hypothetical protein